MHNRHIVFVCTGNICRSPMAEGILKAKLAAIDDNHCVVSSMGIHGLNRQPAAEPARQVCLRHGIDISAHVSRPLEFDELGRSDLILAMEMGQRDLIRLLLPHLAERVALLGTWPSKDSPKGNIKDPMGGPLKDYEMTYETISNHMDRIFPFLQSLASWN